MVYIEFPHPDLLNDSSYIDWISDRDEGKEPDWRRLFDWLGAHPRIGNGGDEVLENQLAKCWYSEKSVAGSHGKDIEHFRPKSRATTLTGKQAIAINKKLGFGINEEPSLTGGYSWLAFEPLNYRLSHPHSNRSGAKGAVFSILNGTNRLKVGNVPDPNQSSEYNFLLDPANKKDCTCLWVYPNGEIFPRYTEADSFPEGKIEDIWESNAMQNIRAWVSIIVYRLDHSDFNRGRKGVYLATVEQIKQLKKALELGLSDWVDTCTQNLARLGNQASQFALAARCAMQDQSGLLGKSAVEKATNKILAALLLSFQ